MIVTRAIIAMSLTLSVAQASYGLKGDPDEAYTAQLVRLITGLQKNPWQGWKAGTVVVVRYLGGGDPAAKPYARVQPDLVYQVLEADKLFTRTQVVNGKPVRQDFLVKDQQGLGAPNIRTEGAVTTDIELDGITLSGLISTWRVDEFPGGSRTTREWSLASHPSILLRQEVNGVGWRLTSARVVKRIGERGFPCVEIKKRMRIYSRGQMDVVTTQYLSPDVPGHLVEEIQEFYRTGNTQKGPALYMVVHQRVVEIKSR